MSTTSVPDLGAVIEAAELFIEMGVPIIPVNPGTSKRPVPSKRSGWQIFTEKDSVRKSFEQIASSRGSVNLGIMAGHKHDSPVISVDIDGQSGEKFAKTLGVQSSDDCWIQKTGSGNKAYIYYCPPSIQLKRKVRANAVELDLITNGYQIVAPSITKGPYEWLPGHSPQDIPLRELAELPKRLLEYWNDFTDKNGPVITPSGLPTKSTAAKLIRETIPEGKRNDSLFRIGSWLKLYHPGPVVGDLLRCINDARCDPPLPEEELRSILGSCLSYQQDAGITGHPLAVVPRYVRAE